VPTTAEWIARTLHARGVRRIFGLPGGEVSDVMSACRHTGLDFVLARHENAAALMAGVTGELTRQPGVVLATVGPGAANLVNAVAHAFLDRAPLLVLSAQVPATLAARLPHQQVDLESLFHPITKWSATLTGENTPAMIERALALTTAGRPGPVYLALPSDVARCDEPAATPRPTPTPVPPPGPSASDIARAAEMLDRAQRPLAVVGIGCDPSAVRPGLLRWIEAMRMPVVISPKAKGLVPEDHPLFLATCTGMAGDRLVQGLIQEADLLVGIGFDPVEAIRPFYTERPFLSIAEYSIAEPAFLPALELIGNVPATLDKLETQPGQGWDPARLAGFRRSLATLLTPGPANTASGLSPARLCGHLRALAPPDAILAVDTGAHKLLFGQTWPCYQAQTYFVSHGLSTMGFALPAAVALKIQCPERPVIAITGDGGLAMVLSELETAARLRLPLLVTVLSDSSLQLIQMQQERRGHQAFGVHFGAIDFAGIAEGFGCRGVRARTWPAVEAAMAECFSADRPTLLEVPVDRADYDRML
jgi:acetolactate synthase I/II/III large subunit